MKRSFGKGFQFAAKLLKEQIMLGQGVGITRPA